MPVSLSDTLVVGVASTALFDLAEADALFRETLASEGADAAIHVYREYMLQREELPLQDGTAMPLVRALQKLNDRFQDEDEAPLVEVVITSRNSPETAVRVLNTIRQLKLNITRSAFTGGDSVVPYLAAFDVDLFLTTDPADAQAVIDSRTCPAAIVKEPPTWAHDQDDDQVRLAFDGDAVIFDDSSELLYQQQGLLAFHANEDASRDIPLPDGPYAQFLRKLGRLQDRLPMRVEYSPIRIAIVTARSSPAELRVIKTLRKWGVYADMAFFLGGVEKRAVIEAFRPHIFLDDQDVHLEPAAGRIPSGRVPYHSGSKLKSGT